MITVQLFAEQTRYNIGYFNKTKPPNKLFEETDAGRAYTCDSHGQIKQTKTIKQRRLLSARLIPNEPVYSIGSVQEPTVMANVAVNRRQWQRSIDPNDKHTTTFLFTPELNDRNCGILNNNYLCNLRTLFEFVVSKKPNNCQDGTNIGDNDDNDDSGGGREVSSNERWKRCNQSLDELIASLGSSVNSVRNRSDEHVYEPIDWSKVERHDWRNKEIQQTIAEFLRARDWSSINRTFYVEIEHNNSDNSGKRIIENFASDSKMIVRVQAGNRITFRPIHQSVPVRLLFLGQEFRRRYQEHANPDNYVTINMLDQYDPQNILRQLTDTLDPADGYEIWLANYTTQYRNHCQIIDQTTFPLAFNRALQTHHRIDDHISMTWTDPCALVHNNPEDTCAAMLPWGKNATTLIVRRTERAATRLQRHGYSNAAGQTKLQLPHDTWSRFRVCCDLQNFLELVAELFLLSDDTSRFSRVKEFVDLTGQLLRRDDSSPPRYNKNLDTFAAKHLDQILLQLVAVNSQEDSDAWDADATNPVKKFVRSWRDTVMTQTHRLALEKLNRRTLGRANNEKIRPDGRHGSYKSIMLNLTALAVSAIWTTCNDPSAVYYDQQSDERPTDDVHLWSKLNRDNCLSGIRLLNGEILSANLSNNISLLFFRTKHSLTGIPYNFQTKRFPASVAWNCRSSKYLANRPYNKFEKLWPHKIQDHVESYQITSTTGPAARTDRQTNNNGNSNGRPTATTTTTTTESARRTMVHVKSSLATVTLLSVNKLPTSQTLPRRHRPSPLNIFQNTAIKVTGVKLNICTTTTMKSATDRAHVPLTSYVKLALKRRPTDETTDTVIFEPRGRAQTPNGVDNLLREIFNPIGRCTSRIDEDQRWKSATSTATTTNRAQLNDNTVPVRRHVLRDNSDKRTSYFFDNLVSTLLVITKLLAIETNYINRSNVEFFEQFRNIKRCMKHMQIEMDKVTRIDEMLLARWKEKKSLSSIAKSLESALNSIIQISETLLLCGRYDTYRQLSVLLKDVLILQQR